MATPIWKDYAVDLGTTDGQAFTIYDASDNTGNVIYKGKAYIKPGETNATVRVNDICADYLKQLITADLSASSAVYTGDTDVPATRAFSLYVGTTRIANWVMYLNWEYKDGNIDKLNKTANDPITGRIQTGMKGPFSLLSMATSVYVTYSAGTGGGVFSYGRAPFNLFYRASGSRLTLSASNASVAYQVIPKCHRYALYYVNELGGVDVLVIEGKWTMKDSYKRDTFKQTYGNGGTIYRGEVDYHNDITRTWELHTGWLTDAEAGRMRHLLGSTLVFLCDCDDDYALHPVIITNADCPYKHRRWDGMIEYGINVELARDITRR